MPKLDRVVDNIDARILQALTDDPRASLASIAETTGLARNTVHSRVTRLERDGVLQSFERRIDPATLGYSLTAFIFVEVTQRKLAAIVEELRRIPEVLEVNGLSGVTDLFVQTVARDADDLYRIAGKILDIDGVEKTTTALAMRRLLDYRIEPLVSRLVSTRQIL
jgi:DNA-binding Lrp family transcriptional regulator